MRKIEMQKACPYPYEEIVGREQEMIEVVAGLYGLREGMPRGRFLRMMAALVVRIGYQGEPGPAEAMKVFNHLLAVEIVKPSLPDFESGNGEFMESKQHE